MKISGQTINCLKDILTGDSKITDYKSGPELVEFFNSIGFNDKYMQGFPSRWLYTKNKLEEINNTKKLKDLLETFFNPINFINKGVSLKKALNILNQYMEYDGYEILIKNKKCIINKKEESLISARNKIDRDFSKEQIKKCRDKIKNNDYDGAITNARSLVEDVLADIYGKIRKEEMLKTGDLLKDYKQIKDLLNLSDDKFANDSIKSLLRGFNAIIYGLDSLSNQMGDRHRRMIKPIKHHSELVVNSAFTIINFLYETFYYQEKKKDDLIKELIKILDTDIRFFSREELLEQKDIKKFLSKCDIFLKNIIKEWLIDNYEINHFKESDIYFSSLFVLFDSLNEEDVKKIFKRHKKNNQACGLKPFLKEIFKEKPEFIKNREIEEFIKNNEEGKRLELRDLPF